MHSQWEKFYYKLAMGLFYNVRDVRTVISGGLGYQRRNGKVEL